MFRTKESTITEADIEVILDEGRKRTEELNEKLKVADKGDMYDFKLDGGFNAQVRVCVILVDSNVTTHH